MAHNSSTLAWKIPWMEEPGRLQSMGSLESDTTERLHFDFSLSCTGEGNGNPLQCSCLENPRDEEAWWAAVCGVAQSQTRLKQLSSSSVYISVLLFTNQSSSAKPHFKYAIDTSDQQFCWTVQVYTREVFTRCSLNAFYIFHYPIYLPVEGEHHFHSIRELEGIWRGMCDMMISERTFTWYLIEGNCLLFLSRGITSLSAL